MLASFALTTTWSDIVAKQKTYTLTAEQAEVLESLVEAGDFDSVEEALDEAIDLLLVSDEEAWRSSCR
jgi:Arc/MetJ-type ribon-helix-helix transcriptional regulator